MKTKSFNYFRNAFALIGFFIIACSVAEPTVEPEPPVQSNIGKYQVSLAQSVRSNGTGQATTMVVVNTETGSSKTYYTTENSNQWFYRDTHDITFTH